MASACEIALKLLIFTRYPEPGLTKTRLIPALGPRLAARLQRRLSEAVVQVARQFARENLATSGGKVTIRVCFSGGNSRKMRAWLGQDLEYQRQAAGDLGQRLTQATKLAFQSRLANQSCEGLECGLPLEQRSAQNNAKTTREMVMVVGSDLPELSLAILRQALRELRDHDLVLGPAGDGGYYLLGLKKPQPELFRDIAWGSELVGEQTLAAARRLNLQCALLPELNDIDRPEDLTRLEHNPNFTDILMGTATHFPAPDENGKSRDSHHAPSPPPLLSVIIPTLNEAAVLGATLAALKSKQHPAGAMAGAEAAGARVEVIVADGGSQDATREIATRAGASFLTIAGGRAAQLNAGAATAKGIYLFFLHADSQPPANYPELIQQALSDPATVAGAFSLQIDSDKPAPRLIEWGANHRSRLCRLPYGDQGLFMEKRVFNEMQGFAPLPIMEDFELIRRLSKRGWVLTLKEPMLSSARRWQQLGPLRAWLINQLMLLGFIIGVAPERLARFYRRQRG